MCKSRTILESLKKRKDHGMTEAQLELAEAQVIDTERHNKIQEERYEETNKRLTNLESLAEDQSEKTDAILEKLDETVKKAHYWDLMKSIVTSKTFIVVLVVFIVAIGGGKVLDAVVDLGIKAKIPFVIQEQNMMR